MAGGLRPRAPIPAVAGVVRKATRPRGRARRSGRRGAGARRPKAVRPDVGADATGEPSLTATGATSTTMRIPVLRYATVTQTSSFRDAYICSTITFEHAFDSRGSGTAGSQGDEVGLDEPPFWPDDLPGPYGGPLASRLKTSIVKSSTWSWPASPLHRRRVVDSRGDLPHDNRLAEPSNLVDMYPNRASPVW